MQLRYAALCAGNVNLAASAFMRQLDHPMERRRALLTLQTFAGEEGVSRGLEGEIFERRDVQAAIARAAHIRAFPILHPY